MQKEGRGDYFEGGVFPEFPSLDEAQKVAA